MNPPLQLQQYYMKPNTQEQIPIVQSVGNVHLLASWINQHWRWRGLRLFILPVRLISSRRIGCGCRGRCYRRDNLLASGHLRMALGTGSLATLRVAWRTGTLRVPLRTALRETPFSERQYRIILAQRRISMDADPSQCNPVEPKGFPLPFSMRSSSL